MKNVFKMLFVALFLIGLSVSCTPDNNLDEGKVQQIEKEKVCPPGNPNC